MFICKHKCFCVHTVYFIYIFRWDFSRVIVLFLFDYLATLWPVRKLSKSNFTDEFSCLTYQAHEYFVLHREGVDLPRLSVTLFYNGSFRCLAGVLNILLILTLIHINVFYDSLVYNLTIACYILNYIHLNICTEFWNTSWMSQYCMCRIFPVYTINNDPSLVFIYCLGNIYTGIPCVYESGQRNPK